MSTRLPVEAWTAAQHAAMRRWIVQHGLRPDLVPDDAVIWSDGTHWHVECLRADPATGEPLHDPDRGGWQRHYVAVPAVSDCPWPVTG